jgi:hypothetical protein
LFRDAYCVQRLTAVLTPELYRDAYRDSVGTFEKQRFELPLLDRLFSRMSELADDPDAALRQRQYWNDCLASTSTLAAGYVAMYFSEAEVGRQLLGLIHEGSDAAISEGFATLRSGGRRVVQEHQRTAL